MKKIFLWVMLATSITATAFAQSKTDKTFGLQPDAIRRRYLVDLGRGNKMQIALTSQNDLSLLGNIDSLVALYLQDIKPFKDSLADELAAKRIDYRPGTDGKNKLRIQVFASKGSSFVLREGVVSALKIEQDTINIIASVPILSTGTPSAEHLFFISFFLNQYTDISAYTEGRLNEKIQALQKSEHARWSRLDDSIWTIKGGDHSITAAHPGGFISAEGDYLNLHAGLGLQNYKNYFVPSFNLGATLVFSSKLAKQKIGVSWEPNFFFAKNSAGSLQTYRDDFLTLLLGRKARHPLENDAPHINFMEELSISYLIRRSGDFIDPHTFRIGTGAVNLLEEKIKLQPVFYFHDFFKNLTPGVRLSVSF